MYELESRSAYGSGGGLAYKLEFQSESESQLESQSESQLELQSESESELESESEPD